MDSKGNLIVISGFSGAGKGTVVKRLVEKYGYSLSVSATTRPPRPGEVDGREYFFKTTDEFRNMIDYNGFIEWAQYVENYYGTPRRFVEDELKKGSTVLLEIEVQGAKNVLAQYPDAILLFITTKDAETLKERLMSRGSETVEQVEKRIRRAAEEAKETDVYEYVVINDDLETCVEDVHAIITARSCERKRRAALLETLKSELQTFAGKGE